MMTTNSIKALLVDDEASARENLTDLLIKFCPEVQIVGEAVNVDNALKQIRKHQPNVVFLDIEMPRKSGFELIKAFGDVNFYIIFVTAYDQYAVKAFEVSAIDYLLKPIAVERLQEAVRKLSLQQEKDSYKTRLEALKTNIRNTAFKNLIIPYKSGYISIHIQAIIAIEAERMYSNLYVRNPKTKTVVHYLYSKNLGYFEHLLEQHASFLRVHHSWMLNTDYVQFYSRKNRNIVLKGSLTVPVGKTYKAVFEDFMGF